MVFFKSNNSLFLTLNYVFFFLTFQVFHSFILFYKVYFTSQALKEDNPAAALASFYKVIELEAGEKGEWGFKALKQMIKINYKLVSDFYNTMVYVYDSDLALLT